MVQVRYLQILLKIIAFKVGSVSTVILKDSPYHTLLSNEIYGIPDNIDFISSFWRQ